ncbi:hypothetical protein ADE_42240 [Achromobacter denitrificans]|nr:hypothetical protein ADE_42240 [Achromobacter denitrificans]
MITQPVAPGRFDHWDGILSAYADCLIHVQSKLSDAEVRRFLEVGALVFPHLLPGRSAATLDRGGAGDVPPQAFLRCVGDRPGIQNRQWRNANLRPKARTSSPSTEAVTSQ